MVEENVLACILSVLSDEVILSASVMAIVNF